MSNGEQYLELKQKLNDLRAEMTTVAKAYFQESSLALFAAHPVLKTFAWTQYTPYFNDGDPCVFGAHVDYPYVNDEEFYDWKNAPTEDPATLAGRAVRDFLRAFSEPDLQEMFGDHCRVVVTREGVRVEEYSHD